MTDQRFTELLGKQLAGEISPDESVELKSTLADNTARRQEYHLLQGYFESEPVDDENIDQVFDRIKSRITISQSPDLKINDRKSYPIWLKIAAVLAIVFAGLLLYNSDWLFFSANQLTLTSTQTKAAEIKTIVLADGSVVKINAKSKLKYPKQFKGDTRNVYLSGEAFFDVKKDARHPFIVHTKQFDVKVLGTAFNIKSYPNDAITETTLIRGRVAISLNQNNQTFILKPNEKFMLADGKTSLSKLIPFNEPENNQVMETAWINHKLIFKDNRFDEIANLFERWYDIKITFKEPGLKAMKFTGQIHKESLTEALNVLKLIENFNYSVQGKNVYIYR